LVFHTMVIFAAFGTLKKPISNRHLPANRTFTCRFVSIHTQINTKVQKYKLNTNINSNTY
jgi:hypothetical protein